MHNKLGQLCFISNQGKYCCKLGRYYILGQPLLQNRATITNCGKMYYKLGQVLQIRAIITNWGITITKMEKVRKDGEGIVNIWSLKKKSGMTFVNPNILALKHGRGMETDAVNTFSEYIKNHHQYRIISEYGLVLNETISYTGASPDRLMSCVMCCDEACIK